MPQIMLCRQLRIGGIVAAGAGFVSIPAGFRTGRSFCCVLLQSMVQCGQLFAGGIVAAGAGFVSIPTLFRTGGDFCCVLLQIMVQRGQLCIGGIVAAGAGVVSIPADFRTGGGFCCMLLQSMVVWVFFAVFCTTRHTDRFGAAGCCAAGTVCSINRVAVAARAAADVCAVAGG